MSLRCGGLVAQFLSPGGLRSRSEDEDEVLERGRRRSADPDAFDRGRGVRPVRLPVLRGQHLLGRHHRVLLLPGVVSLPLRGGQEGRPGGGGSGRALLLPEVPLRVEAEAGQEEEGQAEEGGPGGRGRQEELLLLFLYLPLAQEEVEAAATAPSASSSSLCR